MSRKSFWAATALTLLSGLFLGLGLAFDRQPAFGNEMLPRFTEEREAAALHFVKKHLPELLPLLEKLKTTGQEKYQQEIRAIYHASELLADLNEDPQRQDLELKVWIAENKAQVLVAKLSTPADEERKRIQAQLQDLAKELVRLDIDILDLKAEQLERQYAEVKDRAAQLRDNREKSSKERFEALVNWAAKRSK